MGSLRSLKLYSLFALQLLLLIQTTVVFSYQFKVGDLHAWNIPSSSNPHVYSTWAKKHTVKIGDSLLFLYPPSQDSIIQVTEKSYKSCNLKDPILYMNDGNSLFNITQAGVFYFISGEKGHCEKAQKLRIATDGSLEDSPDSSPPADAPSYSAVFGSIPIAPSSSMTSSSASLRGSVIYLSAGVGFLVYMGSFASRALA